MRPLELTGMKFGDLTVTERVESPNEKRKRTFWKCKCSCGNETIQEGSKLTGGFRKSCGCKNPVGVPVHGMHKTRAHRIWWGMIMRCENTHSKTYKNHGARGITVCERWHTFERFWEDMHNGYEDNLTLDRIDNNGNYEKSNCRWATYSQQLRNTRQNHLITYKGVTKTIIDFAEEYSLTWATLSQRIKNGWDIESALTTPRQIRKTKYTA